MGVDLSTSLLAAARARGIDARLMDAQQLTFDKEFDAVFSNAVLHWMPRIDAVLEGVFRALRPGGRFVGEFGGHGCVAAVCTALRAVPARAWLRTFGGTVFDQLPEMEREPALTEVVELLRGALCDTQGTWTADYTRLRFQAERPTH